MKCDLCMALGTGTARDGVKQFPSPPPSPFAPRMHEIKQNDSTHPTINDAPYAPPRHPRSVCQKSQFWILFFSFNVKN